jgi:hypothetical protein
MCNLLIRSLSLGLLILVAACGDPREYRVAIDTQEVTFEFFSSTEGIYPSRVTLSNPNNPFASYAIGAETKFVFEEGPSSAAGFYAWATALASEPTGENQFFVGLNLSALLEAGEVAEDQRESVRELAIAAFQSVLDNFPDSLLFDATASRSFRLATPSFLGIIELNGKPEGDWVLVQDEDGNPVAVQSTDTFRGAN